MITLPNGSGGPCSGIPRTSYLEITSDRQAGDGIITSIVQSKSAPCQYSI